MTDNINTVQALVSAIEAEMDPAWECNSYHPKLHEALAAGRAAIAQMQREAASQILPSAQVVDSSPVAAIGGDLPADLTRLADMIDPPQILVTPDTRYLAAEAMRAAAARLRAQGEAAALPPKPDPLIQKGHVWALPMAKRDYYSAEQLDAAILADRLRLQQGAVQGDSSARPGSAPMECSTHKTTEGQP